MSKVLIVHEKLNGLIGQLLCTQFKVKASTAILPNTVISPADKDAFLLLHVDQRVSYESCFQKISEFSQNHANCVVLLVSQEQSAAFAKDLTRLQLAFVSKPSVQIHALKETTAAVELLIRYLQTPALARPLSKADEATLLVKQACQNILNVYMNQKGL